jgi:hypothetical protein
VVADDEPTRFEIAGRADYAQKLARWLLRNGYTAELISTWTEWQWLEAARMAGMPSAVKRGKVPSEQTRGMIVGLVTPSPVHPAFLTRGRRNLRDEDEETDTDG